VSSSSAEKMHADRIANILKADQAICWFLQARLKQMPPKASAMTGYRLR